MTATEAPGGASGGSKSLLPSSAYSALMEKVEALPAISDSNRVLRSQNEKLEMEMRDVADKYNKANAGNAHFRLYFLDIFPQSIPTRVGKTLKFFHDFF